MVRKEQEDEFEVQLGRAMHHVSAPDGFAERVLREAKRPTAPMMRMSGRKVAWRWTGGALAASLLVSIVGTGAEIEHRRRQQREAERQFALAMQVTSHALEQSRQQLSRAGFRLVD